MLGRNALGAKQEDRTDAAAQANQASSYPNPPTAFSASPTPSAYIYPYSCEHPENSDQDHLCIERRAAKYARAQALWADRTFWLGILGTVAIAITLIFTARAARAAADQTRLARQEFDASHRSRVILRRVIRDMMQPDAKITIRYELVNVGENQCTVVERDIYTERVVTLDGIPIHVPSVVREFFVLRDGESRVVEYSNPYDTWNDAALAIQEDHRLGLFLVGRVLYIDKANILRAMGFRRRYDPARHRFTRTDEPDDEYSD